MDIKVLFTKIAGFDLAEGHKILVADGEYHLVNSNGELLAHFNKAEFALKCKEEFYKKGYRLSSEYYDELPMGPGICKISQKSSPDSKNYTHLWTKFGDDETYAILNACLFLLEQGVE